MKYEPGKRDIPERFQKKEQQSILKRSVNENSPTSSYEIAVSKSVAVARPKKSREKIKEELVRLSLTVGLFFNAKEGISEAL